MPTRTFFATSFLPRAALLLVFVAFVCFRAQGASTRSDSVDKWNWLSAADQAALLASIPPAPETGSAEDLADLKGVEDAQRVATDSDRREASDDQHFSPQMVTQALGAGFTQKRYPATFALLKKALEDESFLTWRLKGKYARLRPYAAHPTEVKPMFPVQEFSYPSGHATGAETMAGVLGAVFPKQKAALGARAVAVAHGRVVAGVHYPSDVEEGRVLATKLVQALTANAAFQKDLAAAQAEAAARPLP